MEVIRQIIAEDKSSSAQEIIERQLSGLSEVKQLDLLTEVLTISPEVDERFAELIYVAWCHLCERNLWCFKFESLEQYRRLIGYQDTVRPIIQRFKRSDRAKFTSMSLIEKNWNVPATEAIPSYLAPKTWSKHILFLLAALSKEKPREEAVLLLKASINQRPHRSRHSSTLIASDVQRVLGKLPGFRDRKTRISRRSPTKHRRSSIQTDTSFSTDVDLNSTCPSFYKAPSIACESNEAMGLRQELPVPIAHVSCECGSICLPLMILMSVGMPTITHELAMGLFRWAQRVSWSSLCLSHLQCLAGYKYGEETKQWSRLEIVDKLEQLLLDDVVLENMTIGTPDLSLCL
ncbi:hypothetical protein BJX96DRAFT_187049 [Aspergillus floccosus]